MHMEKIYKRSCADARTYIRRRDDGQPILSSDALGGIHQVLEFTATPSAFNLTYPVSILLTLSFLFLALLFSFYIHVSLSYPVSLFTTNLARQHASGWRAEQEDKRVMLEG